MITVVRQNINARVLLLWQVTNFEEFDLSKMKNHGIKLSDASQDSCRRRYEFT